MPRLGWGWGHCGCGMRHAPQPATPALRYDALVHLHPDNDAYRLHLAHALHKAGLCADAAAAAARLSGESHAQEAAALQAAIAFEQGNMPGEAAEGGEGGRGGGKGGGGKGRGRRSPYSALT
jgi:hypothetical protein